MKLRRTLPRGREQELTRWGWVGGLPWVMSWGFLCKRDESILLALVSPAGTAHAWRQIWIIQCLILWRRRRRLANSHNRIQTPDLFITFDVTKVPDVIALLWGEQSCEGEGGRTTFPSRIQYYYNTIVRLSLSFVALISDYWILETTCLTLSVRLICLCLHNSINSHKLIGDNDPITTKKINVLYFKNNAFEL